MKVYRKFAVFPIAVSSGDISTEDAWWQAREVLVKDLRFFVASRRLMLNRGVFQPRKNLKPADSIILAKILDAELVITMYIEDRELFFRAYDGENGYRVWESQLQFHPAVPIQEQLVGGTQKLAQEFILGIPYQGYVTETEEDSPIVYEKGRDRFSQVFIGNSVHLEVGDPVQWVHIFGDPSRPLHENPRILVVAEGEITAKLSEKVEVKITKMRSPEDIWLQGAVRFPKEFTRLKDLYQRPGEKSSMLAPEFLTAEMKDAREVGQKQSSTSTALAFIASLAAMILLAF